MLCIFGEKNNLKKRILKAYILQITLNCILFLKIQKSIGKNVGVRVLTKHV